MNMDPPPPYVENDRTEAALVPASTTATTRIVAEIRIPWEVTFSQASNHMTAPFSVKRRDVICRLLEMREEDLQMRYTINGNQERSDADHSTHGTTAGRIATAHRAVQPFFERSIFEIAEDFAFVFGLVVMMVKAYLLITTFICILHGKWMQALSRIGLLAIINGLGPQC